MLLLLPLLFSLKRISGGIYASLQAEEAEIGSLQDLRPGLLLFFALVSGLR